MKEGIDKIVNSKSKTFLALCSFFILSTGLASLTSFPPGISSYLYFSFFPLIALLIFFWGKPRMRFLIICSLLFVVGLWRYSLAVEDCKNQNFLCSFNENKIEFTGIITGEPDEKTDYTNYIVSVRQVGNQKTKGKVLVRSSRHPSYSFGDNISLACEMKAPKNSPESTFNYQKYLERLGVRSVCYYPKITRNGSRNGNFVLVNAYRFKSFLSERLGKLWQEPEGSLMAGLLYGSKGGLPENVMESFSRTGVTHVVAVSGFNITIIIVGLMTMLVYLGFYRQYAFYFVLALTSLFVIFTGLSASAIRAGIMGILVLFAKQMGRGSQVTNLLVFTLAMMQAANPYFLFWDVGFQLSFLATVGIIFLVPILKPKIPEILSATLSAIIMTFPLILFQFGTFSVVAPLANMLILWLIPVLMLGGFLSVTLSFISFPLGQVLAFITHLGLSYVIMIVQFFSKLSWSSLSFHVPLWGMLLMYGVLGYVIIRNKKNLYEVEN